MEQNAEERKTYKFNPFNKPSFEQNRQFAAIDMLQWNKPHFSQCSVNVIENQLNQQGYYNISQVYKSMFATEVYLYENDQQHRITLKTVDKSRILTEQHLNSARREIEIHRQLQHPNIVEFYDAIETECQLAIMMEYLPLHNYFVDKIEINNNPFNLKSDGGIRKLKSFTFDILQALYYIHSNNIIHMDLKPGNFLLSYQKIENDELPIVKLCDFGLSRYTEGDGFTECTQWVGSDQYIAPEVGKGRISTAVDMWSLGMFLHIMAVGYFPNALRWKPGDNLQFRPRCWRKYKQSGLQDFISNCLQLDPSQRLTAEQGLNHEWLNL